MSLKSIYQSDLRNFQKRTKIFIILVVVVFFSLLVRLYYLQIIKGGEFELKSENNRITLVPVKSPRGVFFDRKGRIVVDNRPCFYIALVMEDIKNLQQTVEKVSRILDVSPEEIKKGIEMNKPFKLFEPIKIKGDISREEVAVLEANRIDLPGVHVGVEPYRNYPFGELAAHLLGYVGEISKGQLKDIKNPNYKMGDFIGQFGMEKEFDRFLKGVDGGKQFEVDYIGRELDILGSKEPIPGNNVILTIDLDVQKIAEEAMADKSGVIIVTNPQNGEILTLVSKPSFDPNLFAGGISKEAWAKLINNPADPLQNRAIQSQYPPGSVYKIVTATAGLEKGSIKEDTSLYCQGFLSFRGRDYGCWKEWGHGALEIHRAIVESCDVFFYQVGMKLGIDNLAKYGRGYGLGKQTGIGIAGEKEGLVPDKKWKKKVKKEPWYPGETLSASIGQGYNLVTPIQLVNLVGAIANGGQLYKPKLVKMVVDVTGEVVKEYSPEEGERIPTTEKTLNIIRRALWGVVNEPHGTGWQARIKGLDVAGKTGTVQVVQMKKGEDKKEFEDIPEKFRDHAWFVAFAPFEKAKVAIVVFVEHGGHGGAVAAPITRKILKGMLDLGYFETEDTSVESQS